MPERDPEPSGEKVLTALKLVLDDLGLPYDTPAQRQKIHQVIHDLQQCEQPVFLPYHFWCSRFGNWYSDVLTLDLRELVIDNPRQLTLPILRYPKPWDGKHLAPAARKRLRWYVRNRLPHLPPLRTTPL